MISNERRWPSQQGFQRQPYYQNRGQYQNRDQYRDQRPYRPPVHEETLKTAEMQIERKLFVSALKENPRGRFLRITETASGRNNSIVIPITGLREFKQMLDSMVKAAEELPETAPAAVA